MATCACWSLQLLQEKPRHGYEIIKAIEERLAGAYSPSPGVVYPTLTLLEELGHATVAASEGGRKLYAVTAEGTAWLDGQPPGARSRRGPDRRGPCRLWRRPAARRWCARSRT